MRQMSCLRAPPVRPGNTKLATVFAQPVLPAVVFVSALAWVPQRVMPAPPAGTGTLTASAQTRVTLGVPNARSLAAPPVDRAISAMRRANASVVPLVPTPTVTTSSLPARHVLPSTLRALPAMRRATVRAAAPAIRPARALVSQPFVPWAATVRRVLRSAVPARLGTIGRRAPRPANPVMPVLILRITTRGQVAMFVPCCTRSARSARQSGCVRPASPRGTRPATAVQRVARTARPAILRGSAPSVTRATVPRQAQGPHAWPVDRANTLTAPSAKPARC